MQCRKLSIVCNWSIASATCCFELYNECAVNRPAWLWPAFVRLHLAQTGMAVPILCVCACARMGLFVYVRGCLVSVACARLILWKVFPASLVRDVASAQFTALQVLQHSTRSSSAHLGPSNFTEPWKGCCTNASDC